MRLDAENLKVLFLNQKRRHQEGEGIEMSNACTKCGFDIDAQIERIRKLERENAKLIKFITACSEDRYARVACLDWVRKHKKCSKP